jgi:hypothetical protein
MSHMEQSMAGSELAAAIQHGDFRPRRQAFAGEMNDKRRLIRIITLDHQPGAALADMALGVNWIVPAGRTFACMQNSCLHSQPGGAARSRLPHSPLQIRRSVMLSGPVPGLLMPRYLPSF